MTQMHRGHLIEVLAQLDLPEPKRVEKITHSTSTLNYILHFENEDKLLARYFPGNPSDPGKEHRVQRILYDHGISVPKQIHFEPATRYNGTKTPPFCLMEYIEGPLLGDYLLSLEPEKAKLYFSQYVDNLVDLHQVNWKKLYPNSEVTDFAAKPYAYAKRIFQSRKREAKYYKVKKETKSILQWMDKNRKIPVETPRLLHGDYHPSNLIMSEDRGELVMIDWEGVDIGDHRKDIAFAALAMGIAGDKEVEEKIVHLYAQSGLTVERIDFYKVTNAYSRVVKFYRLLQNQPNSPQMFWKVFSYLKARIEEITGLSVQLDLDIE